GGGQAPRVQLFGSGAILREVLRAQSILAEKYGVSSDVWSVTSYKELRRDAIACRRWNVLHPNESPRKSHFEQTIAGVQGPFIAASDYVRAVPEQLNPWVPGGLFSLGTDGFGRSEARRELRRFFDVDAETVVLVALTRLADESKFDRSKLAGVVHDLGIDPEKADPFAV
ncbi:MAG TPA: pyruvate dehydrogenase (acetyl-transferring), homodimeric type, partial [Pirellulales bacterium]